ncbi:MAG: hypothetical protein K2X27_16700, partial [Candidatus Obscuribacterales bacterium]|nr:hypothetical protein [Candidatus Obscuribacterales bacterium]
ERKETQVKQASQVKKETVAKIKKNPVTKLAVSKALESAKNNPETASPNSMERSSSEERRGLLSALPVLKKKSDAVEKTKAPKAKTGEAAQKSAAKATSLSSKPLTDLKVAAAENSSPRLLLPRKLPGPDTPPEIAKLLLDADKEEKTAAALRKKADKCIAFVEGGMLNYTQQKRMTIEAKEHLRLAAEAEERCQALRRQAELAGSNKGSF